ncbi:multicopper oxidase domain-containing protein [Streptosporangium sp. NPDC001559]|uniref:multicopper oxidase domain-containing protein n=1 Tax=Streptosporangium sp. NPDC001559 TaxID=3366187 RepID=UPI0036E0C62C
MRKVIASLCVLVAVLATQAVRPEARAQAEAAPKQGLVCATGPSFDLTATSGYAETPDGNSVLMWSYAPTGGGFQSPGPTLCVEQGDRVTVRLHNDLAEPVSIVLPGQSGVEETGSPGPLAAQAPPKGEATYTFTADEPGTYLYESGSDPSKQVEMGLYGALVVRPRDRPDQAYDAASRFDPSREYLMLLSDIDPDLHHAVETGGVYDFTTLRNRYFAINGRQFPDTLQNNGVPWLPAQPYGALVRVKPYDATTNPLPALIRMVNVGALNHPFHPHGNHVRQIAQDGRRLRTPEGGDAGGEHFGDTVASGQTQDFLFTWKDQDSWDPQGNPLPASVASPDYRNLTFKNGDTWSSGSAYLGAKGTLPVGTTSQNVCGEWYFPWHSHALNEFTNFDAGFGGMATLLRVDPPGGCAAVAGSSVILAGTPESGSAAALASADSSYYQVTSTTTETPAADWYGGFAGVPAGASALTVTYTGHNPAGTLPTTLWAWRWSTGTWVRLGAETGVGTSDTMITRVLPAPQPDFLGTGANQGKVRIRVLTTGTTTGFLTRGNLLKLTYDAP